MIKTYEGVTVEYKEVIPTSRQMPEFYVWGEGYESYATIRYQDRVVEVERGGEMYLCVLDLLEDGTISQDETVIRYSDDLEAAGITDDIQLMQYVKTMGNAGYETIHQNPWWEVFSHNSDMGEVYDTFYEAIDGGIDHILDDRNW
jgi:hypothetical protein